MKKVIYVIYVSLYALVAIFGFVSCEKDNLEVLREMETTKVDAFFDKVVKMDLEIEAENVIYVEYQWDKENNTISVIDVSEAEPQFFVLESSKEQAQLKRSNNSTTYTVTCTNGSKEWTKTCDGKFSCGGLIYDCLEAGGCGSICTARMAYAPKIKRFYIGEAISQMRRMN